MHRSAQCTSTKSVWQLFDIGTVTHIRWSTLCLYIIQKYAHKNRLIVIMMSMIAPNSTTTFDRRTTHTVRHVFRPCGFLFPIYPLNPFSVAPSFSISFLLFINKHGLVSHFFTPKRNSSTSHERENRLKNNCGKIEIENVRPHRMYTGIRMWLIEWTNERWSIQYARVSRHAIQCRTMAKAKVFHVVYVH